MTDGAPGSAPRHPLVLSAAQMRAADGAAAAELGVPTLLLMENAGRGVAELIVHLIRDPDRVPRPPRWGRSSKAGSSPRDTAFTELWHGDVVIVCGGGANGGDGFVIARHLSQRGVAARVLLAAPRARIGGDAAVMLAALQRMGGAIEDGDGWTDPTPWRERLAGAAVVVDALFGIGLRDEIRGVPAAALDAMNAAPGIKIAVDVPSGLDADTGRPTGPVFRADVTATMGVRKLGLVLDADAPVGRIEVIDLGVPMRPPVAHRPFCHWLDGTLLLRQIPRRGPSAHKGKGGHLLVVAGSAGKTGAALLAGQSALRAGAGLVTLASTAAGQAALDAKVVEVMTARYAAGDDADAQSAAALTALALRMQAVAIGPGIPDGPHMRAVVRQLVSRLPVPMVVDADALNLLGTEITGVLGGEQAPRVLTPHPGEMARLVGKSTADVQADRLGVSRQLAMATGAVVVLKGARSIVAAPDGTAFVNPAACGALATAGSGDVLTGLVGAFLARGMPALEAAQAGVFVHGVAGEELGEGLVAGELPAAIARVLARRG